MTVKNVRTIVKNRYRLSTKIQMNFELSFPKYLIGKCCFSTHNAYEIKMQKVSPSLKGIVFSDTIPLSWFTSSALIPWEKVLNFVISEATSSKGGMFSKLDKQTSDFEYYTLQLNDPQEITIELPWSKEFTDYVQRHKLLDI